MQRYKVCLAYNGSHFVGWQSQPNGKTVQATLEEALSTLLQSKTAVLGCGRTDAQVHASQYILHFDGPEQLPPHFLNRWNKLSGKHISILEIVPVDATFHARFDAKERAYIYYLVGAKPIFNLSTRSFFPQFHLLDFDKMQQVAELIKEYDAFAPFCKTNSDAHTMNCKIMESRWEQGSHQEWIYHIRANRFLRGMVRLIVGASIQVGLGKSSLEDIRLALDKQIPLERSLSAPAEGLFLREIIY